ncbi:hypothetical protein [Oceanobacillus sp. J11TS1]|uniref:hypothetical protein n=1 Tax=Oceanobacillus sp. J11TS1 TaxID=2807191 RepID=UPI001B0D9C58|nr:hypothetical protein [Oceanobacillus sp. J11TS1]GIO24349.1 hypothetical protein J11TS1_29300 [Oceanobacillus sp. J11TS1]
MKRYLTLIFFGLSIIILYVGGKLQIYWSGIAAWGLALISLAFAAYFSKYIPNKNTSSKNNKNV